MRVDVYPTINSLSTDLAQDRTSSVELTEAALARAQDPTGEGSRVFTCLDSERALAAAKASDTLRAAGIVRSPLEGIPVSIKDLFDVTGQTTTAGSVVLREAEVAHRNATIVDRLIAAGAVIVGRTNMTEFAFSGLGLNPHYGTPKNPWDRDEGGRIPGGSSSGAAVSVTDGMAVVGIGSDTGGSVRIPSALCGLTGFKPTQRRVPNSGVLPLSTSLDSVGPLGASVNCCAIADAILSGQLCQAQETRAVAGMRLLVPTTVALENMDDVVANAFERACSQLAAAGALITRATLPEFGQLAELQAKGSIVGAEAWAWHRSLLESEQGRYDRRVASRIMNARQIGAADYIDVLAARRRWIDSVERRIAPFDAMLMPTVPVVAPRIEALQKSDEAYFAANALILRNPTFINFLDGCAISLPCHRQGDAPVGLMLAAAGGRDHELLALASGVEEVLRRVA